MSCPTRGRIPSRSARFLCIGGHVAQSRIGVQSSRWTENDKLSTSSVMPGKVRRTHECASATGSNSTSEPKCRGGEGQHAALSVGPEPRNCVWSWHAGAARERVGPCGGRAGTCRNQPVRWRVSVGDFRIINNRSATYVCAQMHACRPSVRARVGARVCILRARLTRAADCCAHVPVRVRVCARARVRVARSNDWRP